MRADKRAETINPYLTRAGRAALLDIPDTTPEVVIVKPNNEGLGFRFNCYNESILGDIISRSEFNNTVRGAHKIVESMYLRKKYEETAEYIGAAKFAVKLAFLLVMTIIVCLLVYVYADEYYPAVGNAILGLIIFTAALILLGILKTFCTAPKFVNIEETTMTKLKQFFDQENISYRKKGFEWKIGKDYYWLELRVKPTKEVPVRIEVNAPEERLETRVETERDALRLQTEP